jgi:hypothetical protein
MTRSHWAAAAVLLAAATTARAAPAPTPSEKSPLAWVPASTPVVIHINGLHNLRDHLVGFLRKANPDGAKFLQNITDDVFDNGVVGHKIRGVPKNGHILIALMDAKGFDNDVPDVAVIAAVEDYKEFRDNLLTEQERQTLHAEDGYESAILALYGKTCFLVDKKDHIVFTPRKERATAFAKGEPSLDGRISKAQSERLLGSDLGVCCSMDMFHKDYADMVKGARTQLEDALKRADEVADKTMKPIVAPARDAVGPLFQAVDDSKGVLATLDFHANGLVLHAESEMRPGSKTGDLLKDFKPTAFPGLDKMPPGQIYYVGMQTSPALFRLTGTMMFSSLNDPNGKAAKAIDEAIQDMLKAGPRDRQLAVDLPPAGVEVWRFDDPAKAVEAQARLIEETGEGLVQVGFLKAKPQIKQHAQKYKDFDFTSARMKWDVEQLILLDGVLPVWKRLNVGRLKEMLGDGLNLWFGTDGKTFVQLTARDWEAAQKELDGYFKGDNVAADDQAFAAARQELPAEATVWMLIDVVRHAERLAGVVQPGLPAEIPQALKGKPGYVGMAATLEPERASLDLYVQAEAAQMVWQNYLSRFPFIH